MKIKTIMDTLDRLEARRAARAGPAQRIDPLVLASIQTIARRKFANLVPGGQWSSQEENEYQAAWARMPEITDGERKLMAAPYMQTSATDELMVALRTRLAGGVPSQRGRQIPPEPARFGATINRGILSGGGTSAVSEADVTG